jgi:hypothetical protein
MNKQLCPGQDTRFWRPGDIFEVVCGACGFEIEFFKDEASRRCPKCGVRVRNPKLAMGCAQWCEHAKECLGFDPKQALEESTGDASLIDKLIAAMKLTFGSDQKRISHALLVLEAAQDILRGETAEPRVVLAAAVLHDIGIQEAEKKHGSNAGVYQEIEGPAIAEPIMLDVKLDRETIDHVLKIIANHHSARDIDTIEFRILWDADWLINLKDEHPDLEGEALAKKIEKIFKTATGKKMAYERFVNQR